MFYIIRDKFEQFKVDKNFRLRCLFYIYVIVIFLFALLYQDSYENDPTSFVFAKDIYQTRIMTDNLQDSLKHEDLKKEQQCLDSIIIYISKYSKVPDSSYSFFFTKIHTYKIGNLLMDFEINELAYNEYNLGNTIPQNITIFDPIAKRIINQSFIYIVVEAMAYDSLQVILNLATSRLKQIDTLLTNYKFHEIASWNFIDFFYFSTITQATVGYGDILPNNRLIRLYVTIQTLIGIFLMIILIASEFNSYYEKIINKLNKNNN